MTTKATSKHFGTTAIQRFKCIFSQSHYNTFKSAFCTWCFKLLKGRRRVHRFRLYKHSACTQQIQSISTGYLVTIPRNWKRFRKKTHHVHEHSDCRIVVNRDNVAANTGKLTAILWQQSKADEENQLHTTPLHQKYGYQNDWDVSDSE